MKILRNSLSALIMQVGFRGRKDMGRIRPIEIPWT
jgi:hypothetical protein